MYVINSCEKCELLSDQIIKYHINLKKLSAVKDCLNSYRARPTNDHLARMLVVN